MDVKDTTFEDSSGKSTWADGIIVDQSREIDVRDNQVMEIKEANSSASEERDG